MGNCISTPSTPCCKKRKVCCPPLSKHVERYKRIKYTLVPQSAPDATIPAANNDTNGTNDGGGSPQTLHRSNAIRRAPTSRSHSSSPHLFTPTRLRVRNTTPPPARPTSIVPTLMLNGTPSTNETSLSRSTGPTSPITVISSMHHLGNDRPTTLYMVDGEVIGTEVEGSPRLELRWIDALRAPGAREYRTVVDVVEERRSGRLTVVNGNGRASLETVESRRNEEVVLNGSVAGRGGSQQPEMVQLTPRVQRTSGGHVIREPAMREPPLELLPPPAPKPGPPMRRAVEEDGIEAPQPLRSQQEPSQPTPRANATTRPPPLPTTPTRRRPISPKSPYPTTPPIRRKPVPLSPTLPRTRAETPLTPRFSSSPQHQIHYQRRKRPMARAPIPKFHHPPRPTEREFLEEVEDARRILDGREMDEEKGVGVEEEEEREWDWFWVDARGGLRYWRGGLVAVD